MPIKCTLGTLQNYTAEGNYYSLAHCIKVATSVEQLCLVGIVNLIVSLNSNGFYNGLDVANILSMYLLVKK